MKSLNQKSKEGMSSGAGSLNMKKNEYGSVNEDDDEILDGDDSRGPDEEQQFS